jgi:tetratricopeptide (TPR) repeat protein
LDSLGEYQKAINYFQKALAIELQVYGEQHRHVAITYNNLGAAWDDLGEYQKAIDYYQKALAIDLKVHGDQHPHVASFYNNLGMAWYRLGEFQCRCAAKRWQVF